MTEPDMSESASNDPLAIVEHGAYGLPGVARITMNRPAAFNALSGALLDALQRSLDEIAASDARVVVLAGAGRAFCAGHDLKEMLGSPALEYYQGLFARCSAMMLAIQRMPQPVIARVHGMATAAGCQLVAMCDLAVAASDARFAVSGVNLGLFCSTPCVPLSRNLSRKAAFEMLVTGDFIDAQTARAYGLVNRVAEPEQLDDATRALARSICDKPRAAIAAGKGLFYRQLEMSIDAAYQLAGETMACNMMDDAAMEGTRAFVQKRAPRWRED
jgi:enoyl-CoA hydratase/carnithine racemase